VINWCYHDS